MIPAPHALTEPLLDIERAAGQERAKIPAHITVKGTFYGILSLVGMIDLVSIVADRHEPFEVSTAGMETWDSAHSVILGFPVNPKILALHDDLVASIAPLSKPAYMDDPYRVNMSVVNEVKPEGVLIAKTKIIEIDFGEHLWVETIDLMARDGVGWGGVWKRLKQFELGSG